MEEKQKTTLLSGEYRWPTRHKDHWILQRNTWDMYIEGQAGPPLKNKKKGGKQYLTVFTGMITNIWRTIWKLLQEMEPNWK